MQDSDKRVARMELSKNGTAEERKLGEKMLAAGNKICYSCKRFGGAKYKNEKTGKIKGVTLRKIKITKDGKEIIVDICQDCMDGVNGKIQK